MELILPHHDTCELVRGPVVRGVLSGFVKTPIAGDIHPSNVPWPRQIILAIVWGKKNDQLWF